VSAFDLSSFDPSEADLEYDLPLSRGQYWYPHPGDRNNWPADTPISWRADVLATANLALSSDGSGHVQLPMFHCTGADCSDVTWEITLHELPASAVTCFLLGKAGWGPPRLEWFCTGIGKVAGYYHLTRSTLLETSTF